MKIVRIEEVKSGMVLVKDIYNSAGKVLLKKGVVLDDYVNMLKSFKVRTLYIVNNSAELEENSITEEMKLQIRKEISPIIEERFKFCTEDIFLSKLKDEIIDFLISEKSSER